MVIDNELVLFDKKEATGLSGGSDIVKVTNAYKPMFVYVNAPGASAEGTITLKYADNDKMSSPTDLLTIPVKANAQKKYEAKVSLPIVDKKVFFLQANGTGLTSGKVTVAIVADVNVR